MSGKEKMQPSLPAPAALTARMTCPIQVIAHHDAKGSVRPIRFHYEDGEGMGHTVRIDHVEEMRHVSYVGVEALVFRCRGQEEGVPHLYQLKYAIRPHQWTMVRILY